MYKCLADWNEIESLVFVWPEGLPIQVDNSIPGDLVNFYLDLFKYIPDSIKITLLTINTRIMRSTKATLKYKLPNKNIEFIVINNIRNIWIKDWAPLIVKDPEGNKIAIKPIYEPKYSHASYYKFCHRAGEELAEKLEMRVIHIPLKWDIGNFTCNDNGQAIISNRIISDNETVSIGEINSIFLKYMEVELYFIPTEPGDSTGHVDGMVRFIDDNTVAVGRYPSIYTYENKFFDKIANNLSLSFNVVRPLNGDIDETPRSDVASAIGNHINYLRLEDKMLLPYYDENSEKAKKEYKKIINEEKIINVKSDDLNSLAFCGGVLNCISWINYK